MTQSANKVSSSLPLAPPEVVPSTQEPVEKAKVATIAQKVLQEPRLEPVPSNKRSLSEVSGIEEDDTSPPAKQVQKVQEGAAALIFKDVKSDLEKEVKIWHGKMLGCFKGVLWMAHRAFLNSNVISFQKAITAAEKKESLIKILEEYGETLSVKKKLVGKASAVKELEEGQKMLKRHLATLTSF